MSLEEFKTAHRLVQEQLSDDIRENERIDWFEPKMATFENFVDPFEHFSTSHIHSNTQSQVIVF